MHRSPSTARHRAVSASTGRSKCSRNRVSVDSKNPQSGVDTDARGSQKIESATVAITRLLWPLNNVTWRAVPRRRRARAADLNTIQRRTKEGRARRLACRRPDQDSTVQSAVYRPASAMTVAYWTLFSCRKKLKVVPSLSRPIASLPNLRVLSQYS